MTKDKFRSYFRNKFTFRLMMLYSLPLAFITGLRVKRIDDEACEIIVRHGWINQNPFKSMYFAVQAMAAEMSTGMHLVIETRFAKPAVSTLVLKNSANFTKKAVGLITFTCSQGQEILDTVKKAQESGESHTIDLRSIGRDEQGDQVAEFVFTWTVKKKSQRS